MEGDDNLADRVKVAAPATPRRLAYFTALRRLAYLESFPLRSFETLQEWRRLRKWVLDNNLVEDYREQEYFHRSREITKRQYPPKNPNSVLKRMWDYISGLM